jgi:hypothetical protein
MTEETVKKVDKVYPVNKLKQFSTPESFLVEWVEGDLVKRGFIPSRKFDPAGVPESVLSRSTPYGLPWAKLVSFSATPEGLEMALHNAGIWTLDDLASNIQAGLGAIQSAYRLDYAALKSAAKKFKTEVDK